MWKLARRKAMKFAPARTPERFKARKRPRSPTFREIFEAREKNKKGVFGASVVKRSTRLFFWGGTGGLKKTEIADLQSFPISKWIFLVVQENHFGLHLVRENHYLRDLDRIRLNLSPLARPEKITNPMFFLNEIDFHTFP